MSTQNANNVAITGGTINGTSIGATTANTGAFTTVGATTSVTTPLVTNAGTLSLTATGNNVIAASTNGSERMRITGAGNFGIGLTDPDATLEVRGIGRLYRTVDGNTSLLQDWYSNNGGTKVLQHEFQAGGNVYHRGNVGVGVTPPAWESGTVSLTLGTGSALWNPGSGTITRLLTNAFRPTSGDYTYRNNGSAAMYDQNGDIHTWLNAASGTANNVITFTERMRIDSAGNVGIGTSSPAAPLQLSFQNSATELLRLGSSYDSSRNARGGINWHDGTDTTGRIFTEYDGTMVSMVFGSLYNNSYNTNALMTIRGNGNVGIGTSAPGDVDSTLQVTKAGVSRIAAQHTNTTGERQSDVIFLVNGTLLGQIGTVQGYGGIDDQIWFRGLEALPMAFRTNDVERMRITSAGSLLVGTTTVGTTSPGVTVFQDSQAEIRFQTTASGTGTGNGYQIAYSGTDAYLWNIENGAQIFATSNTERMRITSGGSVVVKNFLVVNDTGPYSSYPSTIRCDTGGNLLAYFNGSSVCESFMGTSSGGAFIIRNNGSGGVELASAATSWAAFSDESLKTDLVDIADATFKVTELRAVTGRYKTDIEGTSRSFLIAQDVQKILPEAVSENDDGILSLRYSEVIPLLVAAIKELTARIEALEAGE
jgi:hypothetical protein